MAVLACRGTGIVVDHRLERGDLAGMHVGRPAGDAAQRRRLVGAAQLRPVLDHEAQLAAGRVAAVAIGAEAIERIRGDLRNTGLAAEIRRQAGHRRHAGVVEMAVGEARAVVAADAIALADEQRRPARSSPLRSSARRRRRAGGQRLGEAVEPRLRRRQRALEGGDRLADIGEHRIRRHCAAPRSSPPRRPARPAVPNGPALSGSPSSGGNGPKMRS